MSAITSNGTGGGNASAGASWSGGVAPVDGDTITVANGDTITQDVSRTYGSTGGATHAVTLNGASAGSFGTLTVSSGVTLTLAGENTSTATLMLINQYGLFHPLTGSTVLGNVASDYASVILNKGRFEPQTGVTFSCPAANVNWGSAGSTTSQGYGAMEGVPVLTGCASSQPSDQSADCERGRYSARVIREYIAVSHVQRLRAHNLEVQSGGHFDRGRLLHRP